MMLIPVMFKLGVITTLLVFLVGIGLKGLAIGVTLLILNLSFAFGKIISYFGGFKHSHISHKSGLAWDDKDIHVHLHHSHAPPPPPPHQSVYGSWTQHSANVLPTSYDPVARVSDPTLDPYRQYTFYEKQLPKMPWQQ